MHLTDILRLTVQCDSVEEVKQFLVKVLSFNGCKIEVLRVKPRFNKYLQDMIINFAWNRSVICELQVKIGSSTPPGYHEQHFVYECLRTARARDIGMLVDTITRRINWLR